MHSWPSLTATLSRILSCTGPVTSASGSASQTRTQKGSGNGSTGATPQPASRTGKRGSPATATTMRTVRTSGPMGSGTMCIAPTSATTSVKSLCLCEQRPAQSQRPATLSGTCPAASAESGRRCLLGEAINVQILLLSSPPLILIDIPFTFGSTSWTQNGRPALKACLSTAGDLGWPKSVEKLLS